MLRSPKLKQTYQGWKSYQEMEIIPGNWNHYRKLKTHQEIEIIPGEYSASINNNNNNNNKE